MADKSEEVQGLLDRWVVVSPYIYVVAHVMTLVAAILLCVALSEITVEKTVIAFVALTLLRFAARADATKLGQNILKVMKKS